jgi:phenylacetate-CoA ligase
MYIVKAREYSDNVEKEIVNLFVCNGFELIIHYVDFIEKTNRGKQRFLIQELK